MWGVSLEIGAVPMLAAFASMYGAAFFRRAQAAGSFFGSGIAAGEDLRGELVDGTRVGARDPAVGLALDDGAPGGAPAREIELLHVAPAEAGGGEIRGHVEVEGGRAHDPGDPLPLEVEHRLDAGVRGARRDARVEVGPRRGDDAHLLRAPFGRGEVHHALLREEERVAERAELRRPPHERDLARDVVAGGDDPEGDAFLLLHDVTDRGRLTVAGRADVVGGPDERARHAEARLRVGEREQRAPERKSTRLN